MPVRLRSLRLTACAPVAWCAWPLVFVWMSGCGYVGEPLPPALNLPKPVADLRATQRGDRILLDFTIPAETTENLPLTRVTGVDLRLWPTDGKPFELDRLLASSQPVPAKAEKPGEVHAETPASPWVGRELIFVVRADGPRRRPSGWSNLALLTVVPLLPRPEGSDLAAEAVATGVRLRWRYPSVPDLSFRIFRAVEKEEREQVDVARGSEWIDSKTEYGKEYRYWIQAVRQAGRGDAESEIGGPVAVRPQDQFPPEVPRGVNAVPGLSSVELTWDPAADSDFAYYRIYRSAAGGAFERLAERVPAPAYSDRKVEAGKQYRYRISSVDRSGNESAQSAPVESSAP